MAEPFEQQLAKVAGTIHRVYMDDHQHRMENGLLYYFHKANDLRRSTEILMAEGGPRDNYTMLAGMALEVLLKGIARALDNPPKKPTHNLSNLADRVGIALSANERILLDAMTEHIVWAGRYTAPMDRNDWIRVREIQEKQQRKSGNALNIDIPSRSLSIGTFNQLWAKFADCYSRAQGSRYESAEFSWEREPSA